MQIERKQIYMISGAMAVVIVIALLKHKQSIRRRNEEEIAIIQKHIEEGTGGVGNNSVQNNLHGVEADANYYASAQDDAKQIYDAKAYYLGYFFDNDDEVISVLRGKTKRQIATIRQVFKEKYDRNFDDFLDFLSDDNYELAMDIIKEAP
ncbi:hypothetical protein BKI52_33120 [marine bacterium AO1-C]|nr:hypothetical protein BKI52_33120 [marine bacterium AO1-C]